MLATLAVSQASVIPWWGGAWGAPWTGLPAAVNVAAPGLSWAHQVQVAGVPSVVGAPAVIAGPQALISSPAVVAAPPVVLAGKYGFSKF